MFFTFSDIAKVLYIMKLLTCKSLKTSIFFLIAGRGSAHDTHPAAFFFAPVLPRSRSSPGAQSLFPKTSSARGFSTRRRLASRSVVAAFRDR